MLKGELRDEEKMWNPGKARKNEKFSRPLEGWRSYSFLLLVKNYDKR